MLINIINTGNVHLITTKFKQYYEHPYLQLPPHEQRLVHDSSAFEHLHLLVQIFLQPHFRIVWTATEACDNLVQYGDQPKPSFMTQPQLHGDGRAGESTRDCPHTYPA